MRLSFRTRRLGPRKGRAITPTPDSPPKGWPRSTPGWPSQLVDKDVAGLVTILVHRGEVAQFKAYGVQSGDALTGPPMQKDFVFRIYSMTKPLVGVAMMQLYEEGKWRLG